MIAAFDLDGTLLNSRKEISAQNREAVRALAAHGYVIVIATARPPRTADPMIQSLGIPIDAIYYNGALIRFCDGTEFRTLIARGVLAEIIAHEKEHDASAAVSVMAGDDRWFAPEGCTFDFASYYAGAPAPVLLPERALLGKSAVKVLINAYADAAGVMARFGESCSIVETDSGTLLQIMPKGVSKESALRRVAERHGAVRGDIVCFGDDLNDLGMFACCGTGVAMGNAVDVLKAAATHVTATNDEDGVARFIWEHLLPPRCGAAQFCV